MDKNNKPKHFLIFKILGILGAMSFIASMVLMVIGFGNFENKIFIIAMIMMPFSIMLSVLGISVGFGPEIAKMSTKTAKYIQQENKETLTEIASERADIASDAITKTVQAATKGIKDTIFCKYCGAEITKDSTFCNKCGKKQ